MNPFEMQIRQKQDAVIRACFDYGSQWLCDNGYDEASAKFDKEVMGE